jgi:hypothetical protein
LESYYINNNNGFGGYLKFPSRPRQGYATFGPADFLDPRNTPMRMGRHYNGVPMHMRYPFTPDGIVSLTPSARRGGSRASDLKDASRRTSASSRIPRARRTLIC